MSVRIGLARGLAAALFTAALLLSGIGAAQAQEIKCNVEKLPRLPDGCHRDLIEAVGAQSVRGEKAAQRLAWTNWQRIVREKYGTRFIDIDKAACVYTECQRAGVGAIGSLLTSCRVKGYACATYVDPKNLEYGDWQELGCRRVEFRTEKDTIQVGREEGKFAALQLRVLGNSINVRSLKVIYGNGDPDELDVQSIISDGGQSKPLDLRGERRTIRRIEIVYRSTGESQSRANVCIYGRG